MKIYILMLKDFETFGDELEKEITTRILFE